MNKKLKKKQALIMAEPYRTPFNSKVAKVSGDVIEDSVGGINKPTRSYDFKVNGFSNVVKSSNLLNIPDKANTTINGITYSIKNGIITFSGTATANTSMTFNFVSNVTETAYVSYYWGAFNNKVLDARFGIITNETSNNYTAYEDLTEVNKTRLFQNAAEREITAFFFNFGNGTNLDGFELKPMLIQSETAPTKYEPYFDPYIESFADKKNLLDLPIKSGTINNVSYKISQGNVLTLNGTMSTASNYIMVNDLNLVLEKGIYTFAITKDMFIKNVSCAIILGTTDSDLIFTIQGKNTSITTILPSKTTINYLIMWINPTTFNNYRTRLMLIHSKTAPSTFLPYQDKYSAFLNVKGKNLFDNVNTPIIFVTFSGPNQIVYRYLGIVSKAIYLKKGKYTFKSDKNMIIGKVIIWTGDLGSKVGEVVKAFNATIELEKDMYVLITNNYQYEYKQLFETLIVVEGDKIPEFEPYYSFTKEVLIKQPLRKFDYLTYDGVYRQTNEIVLDGSWNVVANNYLFPSGWFAINTVNNCFPDRNDWGEQFSKLYVTTTSDLPLISSYEMRDGGHKKGIAINNKVMMIKLDDSADNSLNNWTVEKVNNYFKQNPITITYKTVDQTFEATSLTRLLFKNGYNKITAFDSINNNAIVEYLEYYKSK